MEKVRHTQRVNIVFLRHASSPAEPAHRGSRSWLRAISPPVALSQSYRGAPPLYRCLRNCPFFFQLACQSLAGEGGRKTFLPCLWFYIGGELRTDCITTICKPMSLCAATTLGIHGISVSIGFSQDRLTPRFQPRLEYADHTRQSESRPFFPQSERRCRPSVHTWHITSLPE